MNSHFPKLHQPLIGKRSRSGVQEMAGHRFTDVIGQRSFLDERKTELRQALVWARQTSAAISHCSRCHGCKLHQPLPGCHIPPRYGVRHPASACNVALCPSHGFGHRCWCTAARGEFEATFE